MISFTELQQFPKSIRYDLSKLIDSITDLDFESIELSLNTVELNKEFHMMSDDCHMMLLDLLKNLASKISVNFDNCQQMIKLIIGGILKMRVAIISNIYMKQFGLNVNTDIEFNHYFPGTSKRTPDYIVKNDDLKEVIIIETSYSSKRVKGLYSKGISKETSKYYDEIMLIESRTEYQVHYVPLIFFDNMLSDNSQSRHFFDQQEEFLKTKFRYEKSLSYVNCLKKSFELNRLIYDYGSCMNLCFQLIPTVAEVNDVTRFKIVEFNYNMLIYMNPSLLAFKRSHIELIFKDSALSKSDKFVSEFIDSCRAVQFKLYKGIPNQIIKDSMKIFENCSTSYDVEVTKRYKSHKLKDYYWTLVGELEEVISRVNLYKSKNRKTIIGPLTSSYIDPAWRPVSNAKPSIDLIIKAQLKELNQNRLEVQTNLIESMKELNRHKTVPVYKLDDLSIIKGQLSSGIKVFCEDIVEFQIFIKKNLNLLTSIPFIELTSIPNNVINPKDEISKLITKGEMKLISHNVDKHECVLEDSESNQYLIDFSSLDITITSFKYNDNMNLIDYNKLNEVPRCNDKLTIFDNVFEIKNKGYTCNETVSESINRYCKIINNSEFLYTKRISPMNESVFKEETLKLSLMSKRELYDSKCQKSYLITKPYHPLTIEEFIDQITDDFTSSKVQNVRKIIQKSKSSTYYVGDYVIDRGKIFLNDIEMSIDSCLDDLSKYYNDLYYVHLNDKLRGVIDWCDRMKNEKTNDDRKKFIYWDDDILNYENKYTTFDDLNESDIYYDFNLVETLISKTVGGMRDQLRIHFDKFRQVIMCEQIRVLYALSKIHESIIQTCLKLSVGSSSGLIINSGFKGIFAVVLKSKKLAQDNVQIRYVLFRSMKFDEESVFKNRINDNLFCTNVYQTNIDNLKFKSRLFNNLIPFVINKLNYSINDLRSWMCKNYTLMFRTGKTVKMIVSIFKYLNVIQFSDYSNPNNLMKKYLLSHPFKNKDQLLFSYNIIKNFNNNLKEIGYVTNKTDGSMTKIRTKLINLKLRSQLSEENNIAEFISSNSYYQTVFKPTTSDITNYLEFINTITNNNNKTMKLAIDELNKMHIPTEDEKPHCYDENILVNSVSMLMSKLNNTYGHDIVRLRSEEYVTSEFEDYLDRYFSEDFTNDHKSLNYNILKFYAEIDRSNDNPRIKTSRLKSQLNESLISMVKDLFSSSDEVSPILVFNKFFQVILDENNDLGKQLNQMSKLSIVTKKSQHESDREIYIVSIVCKMILYIIQVFFKIVNQIIPEEMVVKSVGSKLYEIKRMTEDISKVPNDFEIVYFNGDMQSWSGTDIYKKFYPVVNKLSEYYPPKFTKLVIKCLEMTENMRIIIPFEVQDHFKEISEDYMGMKTVMYQRSWGQGLYHNISSFVHILEQNFRKVALNIHLVKTKEVSSVITVKNVYSDEDEEQLMKLSDPVTNFNMYDTIANFYSYWRSNKDWVPNPDLVPAIRGHSNRLLRRFYITGLENEEQLKFNFRMNDMKHHPDRTRKEASKDYKEFLDLRKIIQTNNKLICRSISREDYEISLMEQMEKNNTFVNRDDNLNESSYDLRSKGKDKFLRQLRSYDNAIDQIRKWSQIAHSDDKNEILAIDMDSYETFVKYANIGPLFFSLKPSPNKDSFSRIVSEMVGLQNIRGTLFDNPNKMMNDWADNMQRPDFICTYKDTLSRCLNYLWKSGDNIGSSIMNYISYSMLYHKLGISKSGIEVVNLPIDYGGCFLGPVRSLEYGSQADIIIKDIMYQNLGYGYDIKRLEMNNYALIERRNKNQKKKIEDYLKRCNTQITHEELQDVSNRQLLDNYIDNIISTVARIRKSYITRSSNVFKSKLLTYFKTEKFKMVSNNFVVTTFKGVLDKYLSLVVDNYKKSNINYIPSEIAIEVVNDLRDYYSNEIVESYHFLDMKNFNIKLERIDVGVQLLSIDTIKDLLYQRYFKVFNNNRMRYKITSVINSFKDLCRTLDIRTIDDFERHKQRIIDLNNSRRNSKLYIFKGFDSKDWKFKTSKLDLDVGPSFSLYNEDIIIRFKTLLSRSVTEIENYMKFKVNEYLLDYNLDRMDEIKDFITSSNLNIRIIFKLIKDEILKSILIVLFDLSIYNNKIDFNINSNLKMILLTKTEEYTFYKIVSEGFLVDILVQAKDYAYTFKRDASLYRKLISDSRLSRFNLQDKIDLLSDAINPVYQFLNLSGVFIELNFNPLSKEVKRQSNKQLREKITIRLDEFHKVYSDLIRNTIIIRDGGNIKMINIEFYNNQKNFELFSDKYSRLEYGNIIKLKVHCDKSSGVISSPEPHKYYFDIDDTVKKTIGFKFKKEIIASWKDLKSINAIRNVPVVPSKIDSQVPYIYLNNFYNFDQAQNASEFNNNKFMLSLSEFEKKVLLKLKDYERDPLYSHFNDIKIDRKNKYKFTKKLVNGMNMTVDKSISKYHIHQFLFSLQRIIESLENKEKEKKITKQDSRLIIAFYNSLNFLVSSTKFLSSKMDVEFKVNLDASDVINFIKGSTKIRTDLKVYIFNHISIEFESYRIENSPIKEINDEIYENLKSYGDINVNVVDHNTLKEKNNDIDQLNKKLTIMNQKFENINSKFKMKDEMFKSIKEDKEDLEIKLIMKKNELDDVNKELNTLKSSSKSKIQDLEDQLELSNLSKEIDEERIKEELSAEKKQIDLLKKNVRLLELEKKQKDKKLETYKEENEKELKDLSSKLEAVIKELSEIKYELEREKRGKESSKVQLMKLQEQLSKIQIEKDQLNFNNKSLNDKIDYLEKELELIREENIRIKKDIEEKAKLITTKDSEISELKEIIEKEEINVEGKELILVDRENNVDAKVKKEEMRIESLVMQIKNLMEPKINLGFRWQQILHVNNLELSRIRKILKLSQGEKAFAIKDLTKNVNSCFLRDYKYNLPNYIEKVNFPNELEGKVNKELFDYIKEKSPNSFITDNILNRDQFEKVYAKRKITGYKFMGYDHKFSNVHINFDIKKGDLTNYGGLYKTPSMGKLEEGDIGFSSYEEGVVIEVKKPKYLSIHSAYDNISSINNLLSNKFVIDEHIDDHKLSSFLFKIPSAKVNDLKEIIHKKNNFIDKEKLYSFYRDFNLNVIILNKEDQSVTMDVTDFEDVIVFEIGQENSSVLIDNSKKKEIDDFRTSENNKDKHKQSLEKCFMKCLVEKKIVFSVDDLSLDWFEQKDAYNSLKAYEDKFKEMNPTNPKLVFLSMLEKMSPMLNYKLEYNQDRSGIIFLSKEEEEREITQINPRDCERYDIKPYFALDLKGVVKVPSDISRNWYDGPEFEECLSPYSKPGDIPKGHFKKVLQSNEEKTGFNISLDPNSGANCLFFYKLKEIVVKSNYKPGMQLLDNELFVDRQENGDLTIKKNKIIGIAYNIDSLSSSDWFDDKELIDEIKKCKNENASRLKKIKIFGYRLDLWAIREFSSKFKQSSIPASDGNSQIFFERVTI